MAESGILKRDKTAVSFLVSDSRHACFLYSISKYGLLFGLHSDWHGRCYSDMRNRAIVMPKPTTKESAV